VDELERLDEDLFDAVVVGAALERSVEPVAFLERLAPLVSDGGCVVLAVSNGTHLASRLRALAGESSPGGGAAFTRSSLVDVLESSGLVPTHWRRLRSGTSNTWSPAVPEPVRAWLAGDPEAATERFVVRAAVAREADRLRSLRVDLDEQLAAARRREAELVAELEALRAGRSSEDALRAELETRAAREEELRAMLLDAHDQLMRRDDELVRRGRAAVQLQPRLPVVKHRLVMSFPRAAAAYRRLKRRP
jgi:hypothetical protein